MLIPVLIISSLVHIYSISYMSNDPHNQRFFSYLSLFTFMMIILVTANNYLLLFVGWEGVGVCSYLLVSFWFTRIAANQSSMSAFLTNRVGDCLFTIGMFVILWSFGNNQEIVKESNVRKKYNSSFARLCWLCCLADFLKSAFRLLKYNGILLFVSLASAPFVAGARKVKIQLRHYSSNV
jgi:NADH:ubiquinone oxidoreductase subunit 5 (subunit L)/multisubunit Na+/H+ antiporter MnhA subunit